MFLVKIPMKSPLKLYFLKSKSGHIKSVKKRVKFSTPKLELDDHDAGRFLGETKN